MLLPVTPVPIYIPDKLHEGLFPPRPGRHLLPEIVSVDKPAPHFLFPLRGEILRLHALSQSCKARLGADAPVCFSWVALTPQ